MQRHNLYACPVGDSLWSPNGGTESPEGDGWYGSPPGRSFYSCKRNQNTLGAVPQDPLAAKLRLDTNDVNIVRTAPQIRSQGACGAFYVGKLQTDSRKS